MEISEKKQKLLKKAMSLGKHSKLDRTMEAVLEVYDFVCTEKFSRLPKSVETYNFPLTTFTHQVNILSGIKTTKTNFRSRGATVRRACERIGIEVFQGGGGSHNFIILKRRSVFPADGEPKEMVDERGREKQ